MNFENSKEEQQIKSSFQELQAVLNTVVDGIITINDKGIIQAFNPAAENIFGYNTDEVIGKNVRMLMPSSYSKHHNQYIQNYLKTGQAQVIGIGREVAAQKKDGSIFPMELGISEFSVSNKRMFVGIIRDISERKTAEDRLSNSIQELQAVLNTVVDGIITINDKGIIQAFNPAAENIFGYNTDEVIGKNVRMLMPSSYSKHHNQYIQNYLKTGQAQVIGIGREVAAQKKDGSIFPMELGISEFSVSNKRMFVGIIRDISERKQFEEKIKREKEIAEKANAYKSQFLFNMSHELRTPLHSTLGLVESILEKIDTMQKEKQVVPA